MMSLPADLCGGSRVTVHRGPCMWLGGVGVGGGDARMSGTGAVPLKSAQVIHGKNKNRCLQLLLSFQGGPTGSSLKRAG